MELVISWKLTGTNVILHKWHHFCERFVLINNDFIEFVYHNRWFLSQWQLIYRKYVFEIAYNNCVQSDLKSEFIRKIFHVEIPTQYRSIENVSITNIDFGRCSWEMRLVTCWKIISSSAVLKGKHWGTSKSRETMFINSVSLICMKICLLSLLESTNRACN